MSSLDWIADIDDIQSINRRIQRIEQELSQLQNTTPAIENINDKVHGLISTLQLAINNEDLSTIDALILSYGEIPNLVDARQLISEKKELKVQQQQEVAARGIEDEVFQMTEFDLDHLKLLRRKIDSLEIKALKQTHIKNFEAKINQLKSKLVDHLKLSLKTKAWINSPIVQDPTDQQFKNLINLQSLLFHQESTLWAFELISDNFKISFDYHFNGDKDTNRIDKPELFFTYHLNYLDSHLSKINRLFDLSETELSNLYAYNEFIKTSIIPIKYKLLSFLNNLRFNLEKDPENEQDMNLLIHLIYQTINYDTTLISKYYYDPENDGEWTGLLSSFNYDDFANLLNLEIRLNNKRFNQFLNSSDCFQIDYTSTLLNELKPTVSSLKLKCLFENLNKSFSKFFHTNYLNNKSLQKFKLKMFSKIYLHLLQLYYNRLEEGLTAFNELFKKTKNLISTSSNEIDISGLKGLERLFRIYNSLKYVSNSLNYWNQEFIFIELNELFNQLSQTKSISLFDTILIDYNNLVNKTTQIIIDFQNRMIKGYLQKYTNKSWFISPSLEITTSIELIPLLQTIHDIQQFQEKVLSNYELVQFQNSLTLSIIATFHQSIIKSNQFNVAGLDQLYHDFTTVMANFPHSNGSRSYRHINEIFVIFFKYQEVDMGGLDVNQYGKLGEYGELKRALGLKWVSNGDILDTLLRIKE